MIGASARRIAGSRSALAGGVIALAVGAGFLWNSGGSSGNLNTFVIEQSIAKSLLDRNHIYVTVLCPAHRELRRGDSFTCQANLTVGAYTFDVRQTDGHGNVTWAGRGALNTLNIARVQLAIQRSIRKQRHLASTVACPHDVLQEQGLTFMCTATVGGRPSPFRVNEVDGAGHVKYLGT